MSAGTRADGRGPGDLREVSIEPGFVRTATGSVLIAAGGTRVICTASAEESVPRWMAGKGRGWVTAEYGMLPASTGDRKQRDVSKGRPDGRTVEIQRLIGRAIRGGYDLRDLGERTLWLDCDVLQADGGTRTAAVTGAWVALVLAAREVGFTEPSEQIAAVSLGIVDGELLLDLDYLEDSSADVDMNVVMTASGRIIDIQATAEREPFTHERLDELVLLARSGINQIAEAQRRAVDAS